MKRVRWAALALVTTCALESCAPPDAEWRKSAEAPYEKISGYPRRADNTYGAATTQMTVAVDTVAAAAQAWLVKLDDYPARADFESKCQASIGNGILGNTWFFVPLQAFGDDIVATARDAVSRFLAARDGAPAMSSITAGPYLWVMAGDRVQHKALLTECLTALARQSPSHASLTKALAPIAAERDRAVLAAFERVRKASGGRIPKDATPAPFTIAWFGEDPKPYMVLAPILQDLSPALSDPVEVCGYSPATSADLAADQCERLLLSEARQGSHSGSGFPKEAVGQMLRASVEKAAQSGGFELDRNDVKLEGRRPGGAP